MITPAASSKLESSAKNMSGKLASWLARWRHAALKPLAKSPPPNAAPHEPVDLGVDEVLRSLEALAPVSKEVENRFLEIADGLESVANAGRDLLQNSEKLIRLATGEEGGENAVQTAITILLPPLSFLQESHGESERLNDMLKRFHAQVVETLAVENTFQRTVEPLRYVQTLFRVESASCDPQVQEMFLALVKEIENLHQQVNGTFADQFTKLHQTERILTAFIERLSAAIEQQRSVTIARRAQIETSLGRLREDLEKNRAVHCQLGVVSRSIADETGKVVIALQFQDIVGQKLQHVREAVQEMAEAGSRALGTTDLVVRGIELRFIEQTGRIVSGQIARAEKELAEAQAVITGGATAVLGLMEELDRDCFALNELDSVAVGSNGLVQKLIDAFEEVRRLIDDAVSATGEAHEQIKPVGDMASNVTGLLRRLSQEMHLIGLNAQIQAAVVGSGTGLEVLSSETSHISQATNDLSSRVAHELNQLQEGLRSVIEAFARLHGKGTVQRDAIEIDCPRETAVLHQHRDASILLLKQTTELVQKLDQKTRPLLKTARFDDIAGDVLPRLQASVEQLSKRAGEMADRLNAPTKATERTNQFARRYTMASEREVHMAAIGQSFAPSKATSNPPGSLTVATGELDFFDDTPASPVESTATVTASPSPVAVTDPGLDLWLDDAVPTDGTLAPSAVEPCRNTAEKAQEMSNN